MSGQRLLQMINQAIWPKASQEFWRIQPLPDRTVNNLATELMMNKFHLVVLWHSKTHRKPCCDHRLRPSSIQMPVTLLYISNNCRVTIGNFLRCHPQFTMKTSYWIVPKSLSPSTIDISQHQKNESGPKWSLPAANIYSKFRLAIAL